jgi:hypothetical protein
MFTCDLKVGRFYRNKALKLLDTLLDKGHVESYREYKGWFVSEFVIKGLTETGKTHLLELIAIIKGN